MLLPLILDQASWHGGLINFAPDTDGIGRHFLLYAQRDGCWEPIAALFAFGPEGIDVTAERVGGHRTLRTCSAGPPCVEFVYYEWQSKLYEATRLEVRGVRVE